MDIKLRTYNQAITTLNKQDLNITKTHKTNLALLATILCFCDFLQCAGL